MTWRLTISLAGCIVLGAQMCAAGGADYYVSSRGQDSAPGSRSAPWYSVARVNQVSFQPGDRILFEGGKRFAGTLHLGADDRGTKESKLQVSSYGTGRAVIDGGTGRAISADGCSHVVFRNLILRGSGRKSGNIETGMYLSDAEDVEVVAVDVSGFRGSGIHMSAIRGGRLTNVVAHENGFAGISSGDAPSRNLYVGRCRAENNQGDPTILDNHSGNGIVLGRVQGAVIEYCEASYNGWDMPRKGNGPVGIWAYEADNVLIQKCVSHHNRSTGTDGGGFDFDGGVTNSVLQYNYSHDNHGTGYLICQYEGAGPFRNNIVRYNISQDDGLTNHNSGIYVWVGGSAMESTDVYNNTIFNSKGAAVAFGVVERYANPAPRMTFRNNIFVSGENQIEGGAGKGRFEGNLYWSMGDGGFCIDGYRSFEAWVAATGQETIGGRVVGKYADPRLAKNGTGLITDPSQLTNLGAYRLTPGSPAIDAGLNLQELFGLRPGRRDFCGNPIPRGKGFDIGACESPDRSRSTDARKQRP